jgi:hypothetical protein
MMLHLSSSNTFELTYVCHERAFHKRTTLHPLKPRSFASQVI